MKPSQPYREPVPTPHQPPALADPVWGKYQRVVAAYNLVLAALLMGFVGMAFVNPVALPGVFLIIVHVLFVMHALVRRHRCPRCDQRLITGTRAPSAWSLTFGVFPRECTHCGATDEPARCECERCRPRPSAPA